MKRRKSTLVGIRDVAAAAGLSKTTVGDALRNDPRVNTRTRERVRRIAKELGYSHDAGKASWMASVRQAKSKQLLPIAWLNTNRVEDAWRRWKFMTPYLEGASKAGKRLGYTIEEFWLYEPGMNSTLLVRRLRDRGIEGILITYEIRHLRLDWSGLAAVVIEKYLAAPSLHSVGGDFFHNVSLAIRKLVQHGYQRIGICLTDYFDRGSARACSAAGYYSQAMYPKLSRIPPLFYIGEQEQEWTVAQGQIAEWISRYQPDVIVCHTNKIISCVEAAGYRVPDDIGIVHIATDDDVSDWAGINSHKRQIGALAAETLIALIQQRQFGIPEIARSTAIRGSWHSGWTLITPKPPRSRIR